MRVLHWRSDSKLRYCPPVDALPLPLLLLLLLVWWLPFPADSLRSCIWVALRSTSNHLWINNLWVTELNLRYAAELTAGRCVRFPPGRSTCGSWRTAWRRTPSVRHPECPAVLRCIPAGVNWPARPRPSSSCRSTGRTRSAQPRAFASRSCFWTCAADSRRFGSGNDRKKQYNLTSLYNRFSYNGFVQDKQTDWRQFV